MQAIFPRLLSRWFAAVAIVVFMLPLVMVSAQESAGRAVDMRIVIDMSSSLSQGKTGAVNWLCDTIVDKTLQSGDSFYLAASGENDAVIFDGIIGDEAQKEEIKEKIRALGDPAGVSYASKTLAQVFSERKPGPGHIPVTIIVCGTDINIEGNLLRYSRTENFAYWRAITVADGLEEDVNRALRKALP
jgi:hypothetical protein